MDSAFTNDEVLDWFSVKTSLPQKDSYIHQAPCPPVAKDGARKESSQESISSTLQKIGIGGISHQLSEMSIDKSTYRSQYYKQLLSLEQGGSHDLDDDDSIVGTEVTSYPQPSHVIPGTSVFDNYSFDQDLNPELPITSYREKIVNTVESNQTTVIQGSTGSGKSTQVAQYILEHYAREKRHCNIICTQPRRIAAKSVAKYVAESRGWRLGTLVGYQIAMDKLISEDTRLSFVTTGVLLHKLVSMKNMNQYTHIILDEVSYCCLYIHTLVLNDTYHTYLQGHVCSVYVCIACTVYVYNIA